MSDLFDRLGITIDEKGGIIQMNWSVGLEGESWATPEILGLVGELCDSQGHDPQERALLDSPVVALERVVPGGVNVTIRCELANGIRAFHKPFSGLDTECARDYGQEQAFQPIHEVAAWRLAKALGQRWEVLVSPCVIREVYDELGSLAAEAPGSPCGRNGWKSSRQWPDAAFFDALIGQQDRHGNNLYREGESLTLIDHGFTFAVPGDNWNVSRLQSQRQGDPLTSEERSALMRLVASSDLLGVRRCLAIERAQALEDRARRMLGSNSIPYVGVY